MRLMTCQKSRALRVSWQTYGFRRKWRVATLDSKLANGLSSCWDGVNLDSPDHASHVSYPESGTFEEGGPCPSTHPVKIPQLFYEIVWDTTPFNDKSEWPEDGSQPFVWSYGDATGFGNHGDYMFGWKGDALQIAMDTNCNGFKCPELQYQEIKEGNKCSVKPVVDEDVDGCKYFNW